MYRVAGAMAQCVSMGFNVTRTLYAAYPLRRGKVHHPSAIATGGHLPVYQSTVSSCNTKVQLIHFDLWGVEPRPHGSII